MEDETQQLENVYFHVFGLCSLLELDYLNEASNQERFRGELVPKLGGRVYIPKVYGDFTTRKVMMELRQAKLRCNFFYFQLGLSIRVD